jgi:tight adherence protein C
MLQNFVDLLKPETLITVLIALAAFATVLTVATPFMQNDELKKRMALVSAERSNLRANQRVQTSAREARLRDSRKGRVAGQIVERLNLRKIFEAETSRDLLRQAGLRSERQLVSFLAIRLVSPLVLATAAFVYSTTILPDASTLTRLLITVAAAVFGYYLPLIMVKNLVVRRQASIQRAWSDALDLMLICVESGMAIEPALQRVAREIGPASVPLAEEMTLTVAELSYLQDRRRAFENLAKRTGLPTVKAVVTSLIQSERYGTPLGTALRVLAQENRDARMFEAERKAAALPPRLTVPMIVFFLPVIFVVILGPAILQVLALR